MENEEWKLFSFSWTNVDGKKYSSGFYAKDHYHAAVVLEDIKENAILDGEIIASGDLGE